MQSVDCHKSYHLYHLWSFATLYFWQVNVNMVMLWSHLIILQFCKNLCTNSFNPICHSFMYCAHYCAVQCHYEIPKINCQIQCSFSWDTHMYIFHVLIWWDHPEGCNNSLVAFVKICKRNGWSHVWYLTIPKIMICWIPKNNNNWYLNQNTDIFFQEKCIVCPKLPWLFSCQYINSLLLNVSVSSLISWS